MNFAARSFPFDLRGEEFDAAIHFGRPDWPDASHLYLFGEQAVVVAAPRWLHDQGIGEPRDLIGKPLLFQSSRPTAWNRWFADCGIADLPPLQGPRFEHFLMLAQAVAAGAGAALIPRFLVEPELESGMLAMPFPQSLSGEEAYYLVRRPGWERHPALVDFSNWIAMRASASKDHD